MTASTRIIQCLPRPVLRIWHLCGAVLAVALAGALVHDGRMSDPALIAIAVSGFLGWCLCVAIGLGRLYRVFARLDGLADHRSRRLLKAASVTLYLLAALALLAAGLAILAAVQLAFFPHAL
jgi:hypothetical protein